MFGSMNVRPITEQEIDLFRGRLARAFGGDAEGDEGARSRFRETLGLDRTFAAFEGDKMVGTGGAFPFQITLPGGSAPMGGTTMVSVQPTHRRQGILSAMMGYHLDEVASQGEPLAGLWASEASIYRRFGFGMATKRHAAILDSKTVELSGPSPQGQVLLVESGEAEEPLTQVYEKVRPAVPGMLTRNDAWWRHRVLRDDEEDRRGKSAKRYAVYQADGSPQGYVVYRQKENWTNSTSVGEVHVIELLTASDDAHAALWGFLINIDLFQRVEHWNMPIDDPLPDKATDPRRVERRCFDGLWLRVLDVPAALNARSYEAEGELSFQVEDPFRPGTSGLYRLEVSDGVGHCRPTTGSPDLSLGIDVIGELLLGGGNALSLASAGRITGSEPSVRTLHRMFRTDRAPWCQEVF